jgi:hypothetical protein
VTGKQSGLYIVGDVPQPSYFTQIPNMAIQQLEAYAFKMLAVLMDIARTTSKCWLSNKDFAKRLGCSVNHMKKARAELIDKGYILLAEGTSTERAIITVLFNDIWKKNHDVHAELNPKPQRGVSQYDTPLSWDDSPLSQPDTLTKQDIITKQVSKEKTPPIPPQGETVGTTPQEKIKIVDTELLEMENAVKSELKQYNKRQRSSVAKLLLKRFVGPEAEQNIDGPKMTPQQLNQFVLWWDKNKVRDGKPLTRPKNIGSVKQFVDEWQDMKSNGASKHKNTLAIVGDRGYVTDSASEGIIRFGKAAKDSA